MPTLSEARCLLTPSYKATVKILECRETKAGEVYIYGEIASIEGEDETSKPSKGKRYRFYKGLSLLVRNGMGKLKNREATFCEENKVESVIDAILSTPCCDANYVWCDGEVNYLIDEHLAPTF